MVDKEKEYQKEHLKVIFDKIKFAPGFRMLKRFERKFSKSIAYISYLDVRAKKYIIRARPIGSYEMFDSKQREVIAEYESLDDLIKAGWILD